MYDSFAHKLTTLRESKELKKKDLAGILNVSPSCVSQYENGTSLPGYDTLCRISQYFQISIDELLDNQTELFDLSSIFCDDETYGDLIKLCAKIPQNQRLAILNLIKAMQK